MSGTKEDVRIGMRLRKAREVLGLKLQYVAMRMGMPSYQTVSAMEKGERAVKASELAKFSTIYSREIGFFLAEDEPLETRPLFAWRNKQPDTDGREVEARVHQILRNYKLLEDLTGERAGATLDPWGGSANNLTYQSVAQKAQQVVNALNLGYRPGVNLVDALEKETTIKVLHLDLEQTGSAMSTCGDFGWAIVVNSSDAPWRRNFNVAHELFHLLSVNIYPLEGLHNNECSPKPLEEKLADAFASALLMPKDSLLKELKARTENGKIQWIEIVRTAIEFGVSTQALIWRLVPVGMLNAEYANSLLSSEDLRLINERERSGTNAPAPLFSTRFVMLGLKALKQGKISKGKFCEIFGITRAQFVDFISARGDLEGFEHDSEIQLSNT